MEKIGFCHNNGKPIIGRIEHDEAVLKVNEIVAWINEHEKIMMKDRDWLLARLEMMEESVKKQEGWKGKEFEKWKDDQEKAYRRIKGREQARGEHDPK